MVSLRFFALLPFAFSALASPLATRDAAAVVVDITQEIGPQTKKLNNDVNAFPASGLGGALAIHADALNLTVIVNNATNDVKSSGSFSEADGTTILADVQALVATFLDTMSAIGNQSQAWADIAGGQALVLSDLQSLNASVIGFTNALIVAAPADLVSSATSAQTQIAGGFNSAIAKYSS